jgi:hypothetical protein
MPKMIIDEGYINGEDEEHAKKELDEYLRGMKGFDYDSVELEEIAPQTYNYIAFKEKVE